MEDLEFFAAPHPHRPRRPQSAGQLDFGLWEQIFGASWNGWHASLDGRRRKRVLVKIIGE